MKKLVITSVLALLVSVWSIARAQEFPEEYLGLPGDNLNLYAVMKLFQESETLEGFERELNDENSRVNNLDLNGDGLVDYIMVMDYVDGNVHTIVLRAALNRDETQDVAVFTVQQFKNGSVQLQLIGDEALYGKNYIIEPYYAGNGETRNPAYAGTPVRNEKVTVVRTTTYEVAAWPLVSFIFRPTYVSWHSSWHWGYYPTYWDPWRPYYWHTYYGYHYNWHNNYYAHYRPWNQYRYNRYNNYYYTHIRTYSPTVVVNINKGKYRNTYSRPDLRREGERLYARTNSGRSSATTSSGRVRTSSASVNKSAGKAESGNARRPSSVATGRNSTNPGAEIRTNSTRRSVETATKRATSGSAVKRSTGAERKSATVSEERRKGNASAAKTSSVSRRAATVSGSRASARSSVKKAQEVNRKSATFPSQKSSTAPSVRKSISKKPSVNSSGPASSSLRKSAPSRSSARVYGRNLRKASPAPKASSTRRSSRAAVRSSRSGGVSSTPAPSPSSARSTSSDRRGRR